MQALKIPLIAVSLGGVESLVTIPAKTTHYCLSKEERQVGVWRTKHPFKALLALLLTATGIHGIGVAGAKPMVPS